MRFSKVRKTDYRPTSTKPAMDGLDHLAAQNRKEQAEHDRGLAGHDEATLRAIGRDLGQRKTHDTPAEARWCRHRLAAVGRALGKYI